VGQEIVLRLDRAIAEDLAAMLHDTGRRAATGAPVAAVSAVEAEGFDTLLHELNHALGRPCVSGCDDATAEPPRP
jgi:hypothetical protein